MDSLSSLLDSSNWSLLTGSTVILFPVCHSLNIINFEKNQETLNKLWILRDTLLIFLFINVQGYMTLYATIEVE